MRSVTAPAGPRRLSTPRPRSNRFWQRFLARPGSRLGFMILLLLIVSAVLAPVLFPDALNAQSWNNRLKTPTAAHPLGTDAFGRDVLARLMYGGRISLLSGVLPVIMGLTLGTLLGTLAGYFGGLTDKFIMRVIDVLLAFPGLLLALAIIGTLGPGFLNAVLAIGLGLIPVFARLSRAEVLHLRTSEYVEAANALGASSGRVMLRHLLPGMASPLVVQATVSIGQAIMATAALSFLGLGVQPPTSDWGEMLSSGRRFLPDAWWLAVFPGLMIALTVLSFNLLGDAVRDALDPRTRLTRKGKVQRVKDNLNDENCDDPAHGHPV